MNYLLDATVLLVAVLWPLIYVVVVVPDNHASEPLVVCVGVKLSTLRDIKVVK